jgi:hypothetical protein
LDLIAQTRRDIGVRMNILVCIVCNSTMTRFGWAVEDIVR